MLLSVVLHSECCSYPVGCKDLHLFHIHIQLKLSWSLREVEHVTLEDLNVAILSSLIRNRPMLIGHRMITGLLYYCFAAALLMIWQQYRERRTHRRHALDGGGTAPTAARVETPAALAASTACVHRRNRSCPVHHPEPCAENFSAGRATINPAL